ncbi:hypothetical protein [Candidatus Caldatribacterium sp.]|uniref:hypothetical protein n=1 Tax=Candidatus Caldatribacterium sp. TaxID=2282143 RepID=UPI00384A40F0|nr:hypothetical protein [Candidatus Caldatribacterium sp.]
MKQPDFLRLCPSLSLQAQLYVHPHKHLVEAWYTLKSKQPLPTHLILYCLQSVYDDIIALNYWWPGFEYTIQHGDVVHFYPAIILPPSWTLHDTLLIGLNEPFLKTYVHGCQFLQERLISKLLMLRRVGSLRIL